MSLLVVDTSAWNRSDHPAIERAWHDELVADRLAVTPPAKLEILYSTRSPEAYERTAVRLDGLHQIACGQKAMERALDVQATLARQHALHHRSVGLADLLIAAAAELAGATVWHYDNDYDRIADVTGQKTQWIVPKGSI